MHEGPDRAQVALPSASSSLSATDIQLSRAGFHTFDYARHFMSCCSRMLGLEHVASRGSISIEYYGRDVGIKIMPTGVKPERFLNGFGWQDTIWRRGELLSQASALGLDLLSWKPCAHAELQVF